MARGPKKHLKRVVAPKSWMMNKLGGNFAVRPAQGPHKLRESIPIQVLLRDKLGLANNSTEVDTILHQKEGLVKVDNKVRRNPKFPCGLMDVFELPKLNKNFRVLYDTKGRYTLVKLDKKEKDIKLCRVQKKFIGPNKICYFVTHDGRTLKFLDQDIEIQDTIKLNIRSGKVEGFLKMKVGNVAYCMKGNNIGRVGVIQNINKLDGNHDIVTVKDAGGHSFTTRNSFMIVIGNDEKPDIALPKGNGLFKTIIEQRDERISQ